MKLLLHTYILCMSILNLSLPRELERSVLLSSPAPPDVFIVLPGIPSLVRLVQ